jgi:pSer/pThr/pTyr-binding forkhead associated (FHA) protein
MAELLLALRIALAVLLYAFLALAFYVIGRDLRGRAQEEPAAATAATVVIESETAPAQRFPLRPVTAIGRGHDNHIVVDDPFASSTHAIIAWRDNGWWIEDLSSHNGTFLNDERITKPRPLASGDRIGIGETTLRFDEPQAG